jgi:hypothetical protein
LVQIDLKSEIIKTIYLLSGFFSTAVTINPIHSIVRIRILTY